jgi:hypothetical protein
MEIAMKAAAVVLLTCAAALASTDENTLSYAAARGSTTKTITLTADGEFLTSATGPGFDLLSAPIRNLPFWLPARLRKVGSVVFDDGKPFRNDKGRVVYVLKSTEKWKGFDAVALTYTHQGMQQTDNWSLTARFDSATGFLLTAAVTTRLGENDPTIVSELKLTASTDAALTNKLQN